MPVFVSFHTTREDCGGDRQDKGHSVQRVFTSSKQLCPCVCQQVSRASARFLLIHSTPVTSPLQILSSGWVVGCNQIPTTCNTHPHTPTHEQKKGEEWSWREIVCGAFFDNIFTRCHLQIHCNIAIFNYSFRRIQFVVFITQGNIFPRAVEPPRFILNP